VNPREDDLSVFVGSVLEGMTFFVCDSNGCVFDSVFIGSQKGVIHVVEKFQAEGSEVWHQYHSGACSPVFAIVES